MRTTIVIVLAMLAFPAWCEEKTESQRAMEKAERERREDLDELSKRMARAARRTAPGEEGSFAISKASALVERTRKATDKYQFDRLRRAAQALLRVNERIVESRGDGDDDNDREDVARDLQRHYFRVQQGEYFARMSGEADSLIYVKHARSLYQQARGAYDAMKYRRAGKLGDAASAMVGALENLAQASVRIPEPPRLE